MGQQSGFTLLEVVVAFAILVLSLGALFESFSMTVRRAEKVRNLSRAELLLESIEDQLGLTIPVIKDATEGVDHDCHWQVHAVALKHEGANGLPPSVMPYKALIDTFCGMPGERGSAQLETVVTVPLR
jgi:general secretion pathway protein I